MSNIRYVNLRVTPHKWENEYFGDFEAPIALYPIPSRPSPTPTRTPTPTPTITPTASVTPSITPSVSASLTPTPTITPTASAAVPSPTPTNTVTPTFTPTSSITPSITPTSTVTPTATNTPTPTLTPSSTPPEQYYILAENTDEIITESSVNLVVESAPYMGALYSVAGGAGTSLMEYSSTGSFVTAANISTTNSNFLAVMYDNTRWLAVGGNTDSRIYYSLDAVDWSAVTGNNLSTYQSVPEFIEWNGSYYLAGGTSSTGVNQIVKSTDYTTWSPSVSLPGAGFGTAVRDVVWTGSKWWAILGGSTSGVVYESTDGENWTSHSTTIGDGHAVAYDGSNIVIGGANGIEYSTNGGSTWNTSSGISGRIYDILYDGTQWVAVGDDLYYTTNLATTWTQATYPTVSSMRSVTYTGSYYMAVGYGSPSSNPVLTSSDGRTWSSIMSPSTRYYESVFSKDRPDLIPTRQ